MANTNAKNSSSSSFANLVANLTLPEKSVNNGFTGIYKKEIFTGISSLDEKGFKSLRKKLRNERNAYVIEGLQVARNQGEKSFTEWVARVWKPFAERTYINPMKFFEKSGKTSPEKLALLETFSKCLEACK